LNRKFDDEDSQDWDMENERHRRKTKELEDNSECTLGKIAICSLLGIIGVFCQPIYLMFYLLYAMMECYRRIGCWMFFAYY
jgi:hypothetical protein